MSAARFRDEMAQRRGFVLLTVIVLIGTAMLLAASVMSTASAEHAGRVATFDAVRRRAAAWSAAQAVASLIGEQRVSVLAGATPTIREQLPLYDDGADAAIARLIPASNDGEFVLAEAALIDVNSVGPDGLMMLGFDESMAEFLQTARGRAPGGRIASLEEIVDQEGCDPSLLRGAHAFDAEALAVIHGALGDERGSALARAGSALDDAGSALRDAGSALKGAGSALRPDGAPALDPSAGRDGMSTTAASSGPALADRLTVFSVEPSLTRGGKRRAELDPAWADALRELLAGAVTPDIAKRLEALASKQSMIESDRMLVESLHGIGIEPSVWATVLDRVTAERGLWRHGRIDLNRASAEALLTLPGLTGEQVARIVRERVGLDADERASSTWIVSRGIVEPSAFAELFPRVTTRSFFWRVRFVAGFTRADDQDGAIRGATIWECVVDLTGERARLASLRDLTMAPVSARLMEVARRQVDAESPDDESELESQRGSALTNAGERMADAGSRLRAEGASDFEPGAGSGGVSSDISNSADQSTDGTSDDPDGARSNAESAVAADAVGHANPRAAGARTREPRSDAAPRRRGGRARSAESSPPVVLPAVPDAGASADRRAPPSPGPIGRFRLRPGASGSAGTAPGGGGPSSSPTGAEDDAFDPMEDDFQ